MGELVHQHETGCFGFMEIGQDALVKSFEVLGLKQIGIMTEIVVFPTMLGMKELGVPKAHFSVIHCLLRD